MARPQLHQIVFMVMAIALAGCTAKRAVVYSDPAFDECRILEKQTALLVMEPLDIRSVVQDYIRAFDGDPSSGVSFTERTLHDILTGVEVLYPRSAGSNESPYRFNLLDVHDLLPQDSVMAVVSVARDEYGVGELRVLNPQSLGEMLRKVNVQYLIVICGLNVNRGTTAIQPMLVPGPSGTNLLVGGGESKFAYMDGQVFVWSARTQAVLWNGFIRGKHGIGRNFTKNTAEGVAREFAYDLRHAFQ